MERSPNVLLVTVDCLRRDRLSAYGYPRQTTPFLDSLLDSSLHCLAAHSPSSWTAPAVSSLLTGLYPHHHGAGFIGGNPKLLKADSLPTTLGDRPTVADAFRSSARAALTGIGVAFFPFLGTRPLTDRFPVNVRSRRSDAWLAERALRTIAQLDRPFFCWVHLGTAHDPLTVPRRARRAFGRIRSYRMARRWRFLKRSEDPEAPAFTAYRGDRVRLYDAAIRHTDRILASLWDGLGPVGRETVLIVTADHGEELWEHREDEIRWFADPRDVAGVGHGHNLWQEILLVPLVVHGPGIAPQAVEENVSLVDVAPTIFELIGADPPAPPDGRSLLDPVPTDRPILAEGIAYGYEKRAVVVRDRKLLVSPGDRYETCFALGPDRRERAPVDPVEARDLRPLLPPESWQPADAPLVHEAEIAGHLRELGYIE